MTTVAVREIQARLRIEHAEFSLALDVQLPGRGVTALFGPSGSGKTSCLRAIAGLDVASDGYLCVNGEVWQDASRNLHVPTHRRALGYIFQEANLFPHLDVERNLHYGLRRVPVARRRVSLEQAIELLGIAELLRRRPATLSGGERQRVALARALATSPRLLLMDEPLAALDYQRKAEILPYLMRLHDELDIPIIYVSHSIDEVAQLADHLVILEQGRVAASGPVADTLARLDLPVRLGEDMGVVLAGAIVERDADWGLSAIVFAGGKLWVRDSGAPLGQRVRLRILARDISITLEPHSDSSILNILPVTIEQIVAESHPAQVLVRLNAAGVPLVARITRRSCATLCLQPGLQVWAQIKAVALVG